MYNVLWTCKMIQCAPIKINAVSLMFQNTHLKQIISFPATYSKCSVYTVYFCTIHSTFYSKLVIGAAYREVLREFCVNDYVVDCVYSLKAKELKQVVIIIIILTAIGLSPGGSAYFTCQQIRKWLEQTWRWLIPNLRREATWEACSGNLESREPSQHLLIDTGKPRKTCIEMAGRRTLKFTKLQTLKNTSTDF
jgi:hypothetical protein